MKLHECSNVLSSEEIERIVLSEDLHADIASELQRITNSEVKAPFDRFKKQVTDSFVKKLKAWSLTVIQDLDKGVESDNKHYIQTLRKIAADPTRSADQIIGRCIAKQLESVKG